MVSDTPVEELGIEALTLLAQLAESTNHIERAASILRLVGQQQEGAQRRETLLQSARIFGRRLNQPSIALSILHGLLDESPGIHPCYGSSATIRRLGTMRPSLTCAPAVSGGLGTGDRAHSMDEARPAL